MQLKTNLLYGDYVVKPEAKTLPLDHYDDIRKRNRKNSALLRLPPELRNLIYKEVLSGFEIRVHVASFDTFYDLTANDYISDKGLPSHGPYKKYRVKKGYELSWRKLYEQPYTSRPAFPFALTKACRSIYRETEFIPFSSNTFMINSCTHTPWLIKNPYHMFFDSLHRKHLQSITEICLGENSVYAANTLFRDRRGVVSRPALGLKRIVINLERWKQVPQYWSRQEWEGRAQKVFDYLLLRDSSNKLKESSFTKSVIVYDVQF